MRTPQRTKHQCPHCQSTAVIRTTKKLHNLLKRSYIQCSNVHCGWTGVAHIEIVGECSPSATPNPQIQLQKI